MASLAFSCSVPVTSKAQKGPVSGIDRRPRLPSVFHTPAPARVYMSVVSPAAFKDALLERVAPLDFGRAVADNKAEQDDIEALVRQVEATNKSTSPGTDPNLSGIWDTVYTTSSSVIGTGKPKLLQASRITQEINAAELTARNEEIFKIGPLEFSNAVEAKLTPLSANRFAVNFVQFIILGLFKFNVEKSNRFKGELTVTYLDEDLRISRGNRGNIFVLVKK